ncbi:hypothetical protein L7F22_008146, partial [Adiantum nelumboides]|nr:hypothetical protein [Adiantum nelumboides]
NVADLLEVVRSPEEAPIKGSHGESDWALAEKGDEGVLSFRLLSVTKRRGSQYVARSRIVRRRHSMKAVGRVARRLEGRGDLDGGWKFEGAAL